LGGAKPRSYIHGIKLKAMNKNKIDTPTLILIIIIMMGLINGLTSCTTGKAVYQTKIGWQSMPSKSSATGWTYKDK
jgi:hypothetical protein